MSPQKDRPDQPRVTSLSDTPGATGILLFASSGQFLFMNEEARVQLETKGACETDRCVNDLIPPDIHTLVKDLMGHLARCTHQKDCESIQLDRIYVASKQRKLLRGFCIPDDPIQGNSRFLVIVESLPQQVEGLNPVVQERYHLTEREQMVVIYLMLGFTNKEIASRINLSEYTVKEHLKRIMQKTHTTTRTGLLARMVFPTPDKSEPFTPPESSQPRIPSLS